MLMIYPAFLEFKEIMIILVVAVVIFGPNKIPEIARGLGQAVRKMKEATEDIKQEILNPVQDLDPTKEIKETIAELDPTKDIQAAFKDTDPSSEITKALQDPINEIEQVVLNEQESLVESTNHTVQQVEETIEIAKSEIEIKAEQELGQSGSISR